VIRVEAGALADALRAIRPARPSNATLSILTGVKLSASDGTLEVMATNLDLAITRAMSCDGTNLDVVLPGVEFEAFVQAVDTVLEIEVTDSGATITAGPARTEMRALHLADWPKATPVDGDPVKIDADTLATIASVLHAAATGKDARDRPSLGAVRLHDREAAATDSYRLARVTCPADLPDVLLSAASLKLILQACNGSAIEFAADDWRAVVTCDTTSWSFRLLDVESFPQYSQLFPPNPPYKLTVEREAFLHALRVAAFADVAHVEVHSEEDEVRIVGQKLDVGETEVRVDAASNLPFSFKVNVGYLRDSLGELHGDEVTLSLVDALKPVTISEGPLKMLIVPVR